MSWRVVALVLVTFAAGVAVGRRSSLRHRRWMRAVLPILGALSPRVPLAEVRILIGSAVGAMAGSHAG